MGLTVACRKYSYEWEARLLKTLGFRDLEEVRKAIAPYNDHKLSVIVEGARQGQITRFGFMLLAALGDMFIERHPWNHLEWHQSRTKKILDRLRDNDVQIGTYKFPQVSPQEAGSGSGEK